MNQPIEKWQSLRVRLVIFFGVLLLFLISVIILIALSFIAVSEQEAWQERQGEATESAAQQVSSFMARTLTTLNTVAMLAPDYLQTQSTFATTLLAQNPALLEVTRLDQRGNVLSSQAQDHPILTDLFTTLQANWFRVALAGETYIGNMQLSANEAPYLIIARPAPDGGVVAARLDMNLLWKAIQQIHFGTNGSAYVVNRDGVIIAHRDAALVIRRMALDPESALVNALTNEKPAWHGRYQNVLGQEMVGSTKEIPGTPWVVVAELPQAETNERLRTALLLFAFSALLIIGGMLWATLLLLKRTILEPLEMLRVGAGRVGLGDLAQKITVKRFDEIGVVTQSFNEMVGQLAVHEKQLAANEDRLEIALQRERQLGEMKTRFMGLMSHEFRTPLAVILASNDLLQRLNGAFNQEKTEKYYATIRMQIHQLARILDDILLISQAQSVGLEFHPQPIDLKKFCLAVLEDFKVLAPTQQVIFSEIEEIGAIVLDTYLIQRALINLLTNAAKFSPPNSTIHMDVHRNSAGVLIRVHDQGIGIPEADRKDLFTVFHRGQNIDHRPGMGMGLTIVQYVVERHGGAVLYESKEGVGSTFTIRLPDIKI